jgi:hypothetical protein
VLTHRFYKRCLLTVSISHFGVDNGVVYGLLNGQDETLAENWVEVVEIAK